MSDQYQDDLDDAGAAAPAAAPPATPAPPAPDPRLAELERENAWIKAGVDTDRPLAQRLMSSYDGKLDRAAILAHIEELGVRSVLLPEAPAPEPKAEDQQGTATPEEQAAAAERSRLAADATAPGAGDGTGSPHPAKEGLRRFHEEMEAGEPRDTAAGAFFETVFDAAGKGDERVLVKGIPGPRG